MDKAKSINMEIWIFFLIAVVMAGFLFKTYAAGGVSVAVTITEVNISNEPYPEGVYYAYTSGAPSDQRYNFSITFVNTTANAGDIVGCYVNQSNCGDAYYGSCTRIFVNTTLNSPANNQDVKISYNIKTTDSINTTLGGNTSIYVPWEIDNCYVLNSTLGIKANFTKKWRIHMHPLTWNSADVANAFNGKTIKGQYFRNTIKADGPGDVSYSITKYNGISVEEFCHDTNDNNGNGQIDCNDTDCRGITYSCLAKQDFDNPSLYYSPSGSHGTIANQIPKGDVQKNISGAGSFNTKVWYTMHSMPNGTFKMRFASWPINSNNDYLATISVKGFPTIKQVNKYGAGSTATEGVMPYFLDKNDNPMNTNLLTQSQTRSNEIIIKSFANAETIRNLDTTINITFLNPSSIDMSQGYNLNITTTYVLGTNIYTSDITIPVYFDDPTYNGGVGNRYNSTNENENDIWINGVNWGACNDSENNDFDYLTNSGTSSFEGSSYDCYDIDCNMKDGPSAWNDFLGYVTYGVCAYYNESQTTSMCFDGYNNDWKTEAATYGNTNTGLAMVDCREIECNNTNNGSVTCEYNIERTCNDGYNNEMYNLKDCELQAGGSYNNAEYDCAGYCRSISGNNSETGAQCNDNADNDWDLWYTTTGGASGYSYNSTGGMDCAWTTNHPDPDCNMTIMGNGKTCELGKEMTCNDSFDNDYDNGHGQPDPGWTASSYNNYFGLYSMSYSSNSDYDDYDCQTGPLNPSAENTNGTWCFDAIDNDLDAYYWTGSWTTNTSTGKDCKDPDCLGTSNPANILEACLRYEYNASDPFFASLPRPDLYCNNGFDDDSNGATDCYDSNCNRKFGICNACPSTENVTWDACADGSDNDYDGMTDCRDPDCLGYQGDHNGAICAAAENTTLLCYDGFDNDADGAIDCADSSCNGIGICGAENCNDNIDNNGNGLIDCADSSCNCGLNTTFGGIQYDELFATESFGSTGNVVQMTYPRRARNGKNLTIRLRSTETYDEARIFLGNKNGKGIAYGKGLDLDHMTLNGPDASKFEIFGYERNGDQAVIKLWDDDHVGINYNGFDVNITIPITSAYSFNDTQTYYKQFEYSHSLNPGGVTSGNFPFYLILDNDKPSIQNIIAEPNHTGTNTLEYGDNVWIGAKAFDPDSANTTFHDGEVYSCIYNVTGPNYSLIGESNNCKFSMNNIIEEGNYTLSLKATDGTGNQGDQMSITYPVTIKPIYVDNTMALSKRWITTGETISLSALFESVDTYNISNCSMYYKNSTGDAIYGGSAYALHPGGNINCSGDITINGADEMYETWINITDNKGYSARSKGQVFFVGNNKNSYGTGSNGEKWNCMYWDSNGNGVLDYACSDASINVNSPIDDYLSSATNIQFDYNATGTNISACTLYANFSGEWKANVTTMAINSKVIFNSTINIAPGNYAWNIMCNNSQNDNIWAKSGNYTLTIQSQTPPTTTTQAGGGTGGGGGGGGGGVITPPAISPEKLSIRIDAPNTLKISKGETVDIPFIITNDGNIAASNIWILFESDLKVTPIQAKIDILVPGQEKSLTFTVKASDIPGNYKIDFKIIGTIPAFEKHDIVTIKVYSEEKIPTEQDIIKIQENINNAEDLLKENPECQGFEIMINEAKKAFAENKVEMAKSLIQQYNNACKNKMYQDKIKKIQSPAFDAAAKDYTTIFLILLAALGIAAAIMTMTWAFSSAAQRKEQAALKLFKTGSKIIGEIEKEGEQELSSIVREIKARGKMKSKRKKR